MIPKKLRQNDPLLLSVLSALDEAGMSERQLARKAGVAENAVPNIRSQCKVPNILRVNAMLNVAGYELKVVKKDD
jgi:lambda repressor-like predicted transcriptional regulator